MVNWPRRAASDDNDGLSHNSKKSKKKSKKSKKYEGLGQNSQRLRLQTTKEENPTLQFNMSYSTILSGLLCRYLDFSKTPKFGVCSTGQCKAKIDAVRRCATLCDAVRRCATLCDAVRRCATLCDALVAPHSLFAML
jgi:hypothetical protein